ncbi:MAG: sensor domain-containing protein [Pseudomonadota bacterium]
MQLWHEHFQQIVEEASDAILLLDTNGTIRYANPSAARLFEQTRDQLLGYDFGFVVVPDEPTEIEIPHRRRGVISVDVRTVPMQMGTDTVSAVYLRDVTDRKRAEQAAREKDAIFENLLEKVPDIAIQGYCMDGSVFYWNKASELMYGYTAEEAMQGNLLDLIIPESMQAQARKALRVVKAGGPTPASGPLTLKRKDGTPVQVYSVHTTLETGTDDLRLFCMDVDLTKKNRDQLRLQEAIQAGNIGLFDWDLNTGKVFYSREWKQQLGHEDDEIGDTFEEWSTRLHPEDKDAAEQRVREFLTNPHGRFTNEIRMRHKDGSYRWILAQSSLVIGADGQPAHMVGSHLDITERHATEDSLQRLAFAVDQSPSIVVITDTQGHIQYVNHQFCNVTGFRPEDVSGLSAQDLGNTYPAGDEASRVFPVLSQKGLWEGQFRNLKKNGEPYWEQARIYPIRNTQGEVTHYIKLAEDITDKKELSERLDFLAFHDPLTGLPNRELLIDRLTQAMAVARRDHHALAVAFLDLDDFKVINDSLGHERGDELLVQVSRRLREYLREGDTVARFGGDEFLLLLGHLHKAQDVIPVVEHLQEAFSEPFTLGETPVVISFSIGMAVFPHDSERPEELVRHADAALHRAKTQGRRSYNFYTRELDQQLQDRMQLEQAMRLGLENQEFYLCYQPRVELSTGRIMSLEALVRWNHPQWGPVSPGRFIPLAEETGFILALGPEVLRLACLQIRQWDEQGMPVVPVAVNLSAREFHQPDILERTLSTLQQTGIEPGRIEFEITESAAMSSVERTIETLAQMNARGFHFSIDDFGTAYSSLNYLKRLPVQAIKIDQSFVLDLQDNPEQHPEDAAIIRAIIGLGHTLGLEVIAEGVETLAQREFLLEHGCRIGQGFLFSAAVPGERIQAMMLKQVEHPPR